MGILDWFRLRPGLRISCWLDEGSRLRGLTRAVADDLRKGERVLLVGHFKSSLIQAGQQLAAAGITFETKASWSNADTERLTAGGPGTVIATLVRCLPKPAEGAQKVPAASGAPAVSVRLCDLHVLDDENQRVVRFATGLPARVSIAASASFDDPMMGAFAGPWLKSMMANMGLKEDAPIDDPLVSRGLQKAMRKLAKRANGNIECDSLAEWMERCLTR